MTTGQRVRVVTWLHLEDREEYGDRYEDGTPIGWTREVWKRVSIGPWSYGPESLSRSAPITDHEARALLAQSDAALKDAVYAKLGVTSRRAFPGLPKGPYYDPVDLSYLRSTLQKALEAADETGDERKDNRRGEAQRRHAALSLRETIVESLRGGLKSDEDAMYKLSAYDFERLVAEILRDAGYDVYLTPQTRDGGRDMLACIKLPPSIRFLVVVECKKWRRDRKIDPGVVRQFLFTIREHDRASMGMIVTTAYFASGARALEEQYPWFLTLRDHDALREWLNQYGRWERTLTGGVWVPSVSHLTRHFIPPHLSST